MGTNYYLAETPCENACKHCGKATELHIGKSLRMFQAHQGTSFGPLTSWQQWRKAIQAVGLVTDEYRNTYKADEFIALVEAVPMNERRRQYDWMRDHYEVVSDWLDDDGFSFTWGDFT